MKYYSTRDKSVRVSFREAVLNGIPLDKGLYYPEVIPRMGRSLLRNYQIFQMNKLHLNVFQNFQEMILMMYHLKV